jgi:hypothetical protein
MPKGKPKKKGLKEVSGVVQAGSLTPYNGSEPISGIAPKDLTIEQLIAKGIDQGATVAVMTGLFDLSEKIKKAKAKEAYDSDMGKFQGNCPPISKDKVVLGKDGKPRYSYAPLDAVVSQVKGLLMEYGFSYSTDAVVEDGWVTAICKVTHKLGHSEHSQFKVPVDKEGYMSAPQKFASALTFAKRYAFLNAFGIMTGDEDTDANYEDKKVHTPTTEPVEKVQEGTKASYDQVKKIFALAKDLDQESTEFKDWVKGYFKLESFNDLSITRASKLIEVLDKKLALKNAETDPSLKVDVKVENITDEQIDRAAEDALVEDVKEVMGEAVSDAFKEEVEGKILKFGFNEFEKLKLYRKAFNFANYPKSDDDWRQLGSLLDLMEDDPEVLKEVKE